MYLSLSTQTFTLLPPFQPRSQAPLLSEIWAWEYWVRGYLGHEAMKQQCTTCASPDWRFLVCRLNWSASSSLVAMAVTAIWRSCEHEAGHFPLQYHFTIHHKLDRLSYRRTCHYIMHITSPALPLLQGDQHQT